jgi:hypothetical protein
MDASLTPAGVIATENDEEQAEKYMLPARRRWQALHDMLQFLVSLCLLELWVCDGVRNTLLICATRTYHLYVVSLPCLE